MHRDHRRRHAQLSGRSTLAIAALLALVAVLVALALLGSVSPKPPIARLVVLTVLAHLAYGVVLILARTAPQLPRTIWPVLAISLGLRLMFVPAPPVFSDDIYRYVWDGQVLMDGKNPYRHSPESDALQHLRDGNRVWDQINHRAMRTVYPPLAEIIFGGIAAVYAHPSAFKLASAISDVGIVLLVIFLAGGRVPVRSAPLKSQKLPKRPVIAGLAYGLNPLACIETGMSGHLDPFAVLLVLGALLAMKQTRHGIAGVLIGLGAGIKFLPGLLWPVVGVRQKRAVLFSCAALMVLYLPFLAAGQYLFESLDAFARRWEGNAGLFALLKAGYTACIRACTDAHSLNDLIHVPFLDPIVTALEGTFFSLHKDGGFDPRTPGTFTLGDISLALAKLTAGILIAVVTIRMAVKRVAPVQAAGWIFGTVLIATPILHPWYVLWVLPIAAVLGLWPWMVLAALLPLSYLPLDGWWANQVWHMPFWVPWVEYGSFSLAVLWYIIQKRQDKMAHVSGPQSNTRAHLT